jgi:hypothetical protein
MPLCVADIFIVHGFVVNKSVLLCGFKQTKGKRHENSDSFDRTAAGIGHSVYINHLRPVEAGGGDMTKDTALDLALEALESCGAGHITDGGNQWHDEKLVDKAITAIKQALAAPMQEPESFEQWNAKQHGDPEEIGFLQALRIAYCAGQDSVTKATPPAAQPAPVQEPVAWVDWLPEGTTHIAKCKATTISGGSLSLRTHAFKYEADVLKVYTTDNDNEYPGWRAAKDVFYHLNFAIVPLYTTPPAQPAPVQPQVRTGDCLLVGVCASEGHKIQAQRQWVGLSPADRFECLSAGDAHGWIGVMEATEAKLKEKNNGFA